MNQARVVHAVIFDGAQFLVVGGVGNSTSKLQIENCVPNGTAITCTEQQLALDNYAGYPELMLVDGNYGSDC